MIIGAHVSISGGIEKSIENAMLLGCETFQVFTKNQNQWREKIYSKSEAEKFKKHLNRSAISNAYLAAHNSYLINICAIENDKLEKSKQAFLNEIKRCNSLGIRYLIFHPGSHMKKGEDYGLHKIVEGLQWVIEESKGMDVMLLLETTAGQGSNLGYRFEQLHYILENVSDQERLGVCVDTCHIFAAGYDIRNEKSYNDTMSRFEQVIGLTHLKAFHLNDSLKGIGTRVDRHAQIGSGQIGELVFKLLVNDKRFKDLPGILEIPGGDEAFKQYIAQLKSYRIDNRQ
jgi:deoxyribonuclease-4